MSEDLIKQYIPLVRSQTKLVYKRCKDYIEFKDLFNAGLIGLVDAYKKHKPDKGDFIRYAKVRIRGEMIDRIRSNDWVSRKLREQIQSEEVILSRSEKLKDIPENKLSVLDLLVIQIPIRKIVNQLPARARSIILQAYYEDIDLQDIAKNIGLSPGRVTQIRDAAFINMRQEFEAL